MLDLGPLPGGVHPTRPLGISNDGVIVGQGTVGTTLHAFVWLPKPLYGFGAPNCLPVLYDLHVLAPGTPAGNGIGYEVNRTTIVGTLNPAAQVAGQVGGVEGDPFAGDAFVWTLATGA